MVVSYFPMSMDTTPDEYARIATSGVLFDAVRDALEYLRPALQDDGGDVQLVEIEDEAIAIVRFAGKCAGCPMSEIATRAGIESHLRMTVPQIIGVDVVSEGPMVGKSFEEILESAVLVDSTPSASDTALHND
jgi:Fe-S cluster biogenesis protein NfuA